MVWIAGASLAVTSSLPVYPQPDRPEIDAFFEAIERLTAPQWATIVKRYISGQSRAADASDFAAGIIAGSGLQLSAAQRNARVTKAHEAYDRIVVLGGLPDSVRQDTEEIPLRGLVEIATLNAVQALLVKEEIVSRPQIWSALTDPFAGFVELGP